MGFKGLDFGTGLQNYSNLMAQGYKDRNDLQRQDLALSRQLQQQEFRNSVAAQQAAASGFGYQRPEILQRYGVSNLPVDINAPEVKSLMDQNPEAVQNGMANPYDAKRLEAEALKRQQRDALLERQRIIESGKNGRTPGLNSGPKIDPAVAHGILLQMKGVQDQLKSLNDPQKAILYKYQESRGGPSIEQTRAKLQGQLTDLNSQLSKASPTAAQGFQAPAAPQAPAPTAPAAPMAPKAIVKRLYSASRNQTKLVYSDGTEAVVNGQQ